MPPSENLPRQLTREELSLADYHAMDAINKSRLDKIERSPKHYWWSYVRPGRPAEVPSKAMEFGTAFHAMLEGEDYFRANYVEIPEDAPNKPTSRQRTAKKPSFETMNAIQWWDEFDRANAGKKIISGEDIARITAMRTNYFEHPSLHALIFQSGVKALFEHTFLWEKEGRLCKCRVDIYIPGIAIIDTKSSFSAEASEFERTAWNLKYRRSSAWYSDGVEAATGERLPYIFAVAEDEGPHLVQAFAATDDVLAVGRVENEMHFERLIACEKSGEWPGYSGRIQELRNPTYQRHRIEQILGGLPAQLS